MQDSLRGRSLASVDARRFILFVDECCFPEMLNVHWPFGSSVLFAPLAGTVVRECSLQSEISRVQRS